jgi:(1->4)-alpha-D-glucan 1-alpha-D-glucosylmutase
MTPRASYRLQLHKDFGFDAAAARAAYLQALGVSHVYLSPYLKARPASTHGYDIVDHGQLNPELGDEQAFQRMTEAFKAHGLGQLLDIVPNHMGVGGADNPLWLDVLEWGPEAAHAGWFDIDWDPERRYLHDKILVPLLGDQYGVELEHGALRLQFDDVDGSFAIWAYETHKLPIWPPNYADILGDGAPQFEPLADAFAWLPNWRLQMPQRAAELKQQLAHLVRSRADAREALHVALTRFDGRTGNGASWRALDQLIQAQHWRVAYFRVAADDINYRRFFNINDLAGLRMELPEVFEHAHQRVLRLIRDGVVDGLRIDHIDGLLDPKAYLRRLQRRIAARRPGGGHCYVVVEKILSAHERLREDWPIDGTTGYDFLNQTLALLIDASAERAFSDCYLQFTGEARSYGQIVRLSKLHIMDNEMASELNVLARDMARLARQNPRTADFTRDLLRRAIKELIACFPVYRTYVDGSGTLDGADQRDLSWAIGQARRNETVLDPSVFDFLEQVLTGSLIQQPRSGFSRQSLLRCAMRLQQYSGPVMAKGVEDTAFYRYNRFVALNEVGGDPDRFGSTLAAFHKANALRAQHWPHAMLATATHDTKRGEDTRARLAALSGFAEEWARALPIWSRILRGPAGSEPSVPQPDRNDEYLLYQLLIGSWPSELLDQDSPETETLRAYGARVRSAMLKSMREARVHTGWAFPNTAYEEAMTALIDTAIGGHRATAFLGAFLPLARRVAAAGVHNSLVQTALKLTVPGMPDVYQGCELWDLSMVDPDNRRAVDYERRAQLLEQIDAALSADRTAGVRELCSNWHDGRIKLAIVTTLLRHRLAVPELYAEGDYQALPALGSRADEICAYARSHRQQAMVVAAARFPHILVHQPFDAQTQLPIPPSLRRSQWRELLSGVTLQLEAESLSAAALFAQLPVAVLVAAQPPASSQS